MRPNDAEEKRHLLIFEPDVDGHQREWLQHLIRFAATMGERYVVWFVVDPRLYRDLAKQVADALQSHVKLLSLHPLEKRLCSHRSLAVSGFARWWTMRRYLRQTGAEAGHFLSLDLLSLPLALGLSMNGCRLCGILFRPSVHYSALGPYRPTLREWIRDFRKVILYRLMLLNRALRVVLTLDSYFANYAAHRYRGGWKVCALPDPAHPPVNGMPEDSRLAELLPANRICFVLFGFLTERKGVLALLEAARLLPSEIAGRVAILLAGKVDREIGEMVTELRRRLAVERPELWLHLENRWLTSGEIDALIRRTDAVLAPYQRFVGSSGVLLWAARANKPVLTQNYGLLGRLVQDHGLGLAVDATDCNVLAESIERMARQGPETFINRRSAQNFVAERMPQHFAAMVFASLEES